jgi:hypothetical protein
MSSFMTLLVFALVIAAVLAIIGTPLFIGICLLIARMTDKRTGRGRRPAAAPDRDRARSGPDRGRARSGPFADGRRRDAPRARAGSRRGDW